MTTEQMVWLRNINQAQLDGNLHLAAALLAIYRGIFG